MFGKHKEQKILKKIEKDNQKTAKLLEKAQAYKKEILESPYFTEKNEVYSIETFYNIPKEENPKIKLRHRPQGTTCSWRKWRK